MTVKEFTVELASALTELGVSERDAASHVLTLAKTLTEEDLREITEYKSPEDFSALTESLAEIIKSKNEAKRRAAMEKEKAAMRREAPPPSDSLMKTRAVPISSAQSDKYSPLREQPDDSTRTFSAAKIGNIPDSPPSTDTQITPIWANDRTDEPQEIILGDDSAIKEKTVLTKRGKTIFALIALLTSPLSLAACAVMLALFLLSVCTVCIFIAVVFVLVLAEVACGGCTFFVGLIYGAVKLFGGYAGTGLYEMGLGVICFGITVVLSYFTYKLSTKALPILLRDVLAFWGTFLRRVGHMVERLREECNRL